MNVINPIFDFMQQYRLYFFFGLAVVCISATVYWMRLNMRNTLAGLPKGIQAMFQGMKAHFSQSSSKQPAVGEDYFPADVQRLLTAMNFGLVFLAVLIPATALCAMGGVYFSQVAMARWAIFGLSLMLPVLYVHAFLRTWQYPNMYILNKKNNPVAVLHKPRWLLLPSKLLTGEIVDGSFIDIDTGIMDVQMSYDKASSKQIKVSAQFSVTFQVIRAREIEVVVDEKTGQTAMVPPAILSLHFKKDPEDPYKARNEYLLEEVIDKGTSILGSCDSPKGAIRSQTKLADEFKKQLNAATRRFGLEVADHNMRIYPDHAKVEADKIEIIGTARAKVVKKINEPLRGNREAAAYLMVGEALDTVEKLFLGKKKKIAEKAKGMEEKLVEASAKLDKLDKFADKFLGNKEVSS